MINIRGIFGLAGISLIGVGLAYIYWPVALVVVGAIIYADATFGGEK